MRCRDHSSGVAVDAPAKVNLFLSVLGKRDDGYHEIETLMVSIGVWDTLSIEPDLAGGLTLRCIAAGRGARSTPPLSEGPDNLVLRAAHLLREATGTCVGARFTLMKRIPLSAGLAGGSSDAAAALVGLCRLWKFKLAPAELASLAARLGSDVPFFLCQKGAAICRGRGEIVEPLDLPSRLHFVVARPATGLSTAEVYRHAQASKVGWTAAELAGRLKRGRLDLASGAFFNALEATAMKLNPDVRRLKAAFARLPLVGHMMSGSGTGYFGLCRTRRQALCCASRLRSLRLGDVMVAQTRP